MKMIMKRETLLNASRLYLVFMVAVLVGVTGLEWAKAIDAEQDAAIAACAVPYRRAK